MPTDAFAKLQNLLRELFQFENADLDFGIYRILNHKRGAIEDFIRNGLSAMVDDALSGGATARQSARVEELRQTTDRIKEAFGEYSINPKGELSESFQETPLGKQYLELRSHAGDALDLKDLKAEIFNHVYTFFSRYYDNGDFLSKKRYSRRQKYAIPYNGEEVYLHWANADQYYIKTGEHFTDYRYKSSGVTVHFEMTAADAEQNNVKGERRFFVPRTKKAAYDEKARILTVPFEYRPLTAKEKTAFGTGKTQDKIIEKVVEELPARFQKHLDALAALISEGRRNGKGEPVSLLAHHLGRYTRRNTSDFFVHKALKGFLEGELNFYLKNEVLDVDDLEAWGPNRSESWFEIMRAVKKVGRGIIAFLAQIENFQKKLFEKKKLVVSAEYCVTLDRVPEELYGEIAANDDQREEWKKLFAIHEIEENITEPGYSEPLTQDFLKSNPFLPVDTKHFDEGFKDRFLASIEDLDEATDGLLIESENFQALNLLQERYREQVKCIYIDPPYNSKTSEILYKNDYKHSSWLSLMSDRLALSKSLVTLDGSHVVAIDENEQEVLGRLLSIRFPEQKKICVSVVHNKKGIQGEYFSYNHEFAYFCIPPLLSQVNGTPVPESEWEYDNLRKWGRESERFTAKTCFYPIFVEDGAVMGFGDVCDDDFHPEQTNMYLEDNPNRIAVYPVDSQLVERKWRYSRSSVENILPLLKVHATTSGEIQIQKAKAIKPIKTLWDDSRYIAGDYGTKWLTWLGLKVAENLYPKSIHTVRDSVYAVSDPDDLVLDYFAGSGTTGHAVIDLNREDGGDRKYILVEMGEYFETVLKPRILKVIYSKDWKDGRPVSRQGSSHVLKYVKLESYEDALNNIAFTDREAGQGALELYGDDYLLRYMLDFETRGSDTLLNVGKLASPFRYTLALRSGDGETREATVDLPETFAYLIGLRVGSRRACHDGDRRYLVYRGSTPERGKVVAIWRDTGCWGEADFERDRAFVEENELARGADEVFVNGDSFIPEARTLDGVFKERMLASP